MTQRDDSRELSYTLLAAVDDTDAMVAIMAPGAALSDVIVNVTLSKADALVMANRSYVALVSTINKMTWDEGGIARPVN